jgi:hypothetical protein
MVKLNPMASGPATQPEAASPQQNVGEEKQKRLAFRLAAVMVSLGFALALAELGLRLFSRDLDWDERSLLYAYHERLGWFPKPNSRGFFTGARTIHVSHNSLGFRGPEHVPATNQPAILFLGDSFVWGYDVEVEERFTEKLQAHHPEWAIYNLGVSGYGTDQEYLLLHQVFDQYHPRVVFLVFCVDNDDSDNCWNFRWGYYKPYCVLEGTRLELRGIPVPRGARVFAADHPFLCRARLVRLAVSAFSKLKGPPPTHRADPTGPLLWDLHKYVRNKGAVLAVGITHRWPYLEQFLEEMRIPWTDLSTEQVYPTHGSHWTPEGHTWVADKIDAFLREKKYLESPPH